MIGALEGWEVMAETQSRSAFLDEIAALASSFDRSRFSPELLVLAGKAWAERALQEHASVASFNRFSLALLAVGAPPELVELSNEAALDEILHARISFAIASTYLDEPIGPGPLAIDGALDDVSSFAKLAESTLVEGCIGETISAALAREAHHVASEGMAKHALLRIAEDEERHAELAWAFVKWALVSAPELMAPLRSIFTIASTQILEPDKAAADDLSAFGLLSGERELRRRIRDEILLPASRALFGA